MAVFGQSCPDRKEGRNFHAKMDLRDLKKIRVPVLVTAGEHDLVRERHTLRIARALPCGTLKIFAGETHESYIVNSTKFVPALISFLS